MEWETPSLLHKLTSPPDFFPLLWHLADLDQVPVTTLSPALRLAGTSDSRRACGDTTGICQHPFQRRLRCADLRGRADPVVEQSVVCQAAVIHPALCLICNVCFIDTAGRLFNSRAKETGS